MCAARSAGGAVGSGRNADEELRVGRGRVGHVRLPVVVVNLTINGAAGVVVCGDK